MLFPRSIWSLVLLFGLVTLTLANNSSEGDCDLSLTQPCRSNTSLCVPHEHVGDGILDCPDGSDEDCPEGWFVCADLSACIRPDFFQDGVAQCHDDSDEECESWQHECLCGYPRCIDGDKVGDGILDCVEGSDELAIEKESYICPTDLHDEQEILRKKRTALKTRDGSDGNRGDITNYYSLSPGAFAPTGVLTSTVYSFVNKETTSEYLTYVKGTSINGSYAQVTSLSSRTFFAIPTLLNQDQVSGLVSSLMTTTVSSGYTQTVVSRIYHTNIDGTYAQLVETETKGFDRPATNYVTILQGEELHGTFLSHPEQSLATLQFSHLEGSLNPSPVAAEIVTVTGTYGKFIRDGSDSATTYSVFTGSYVKDQKTYVFFFGNSALPHQRNLQKVEMDKVKMKSGQEKRKVILDMDQHMDVIMPSALKMDMVSKQDLLIGEGTVDGHKVDGLFIANRDGFDVKGAQKKGGGDIKMLTVTIEQPTSVMMTTQTKVQGDVKMNPFFDISKRIETEADNEVDSSLKRGRQASIDGNEIVVDVHKIRPTMPLPNGIPTFLIEEPSQNIGDIILRETIKKSRSLHDSVAVQDENVVDNIKAKFNQFDIGEFPLGDSVLPTITYYGFADFTTTIADTVVIFTPNSKIQPVLESSLIELSPLHGRVASTEITPDVTSQTKVPSTHSDLEFSTVTTQVFNTLDLYPKGLVSSIGGTLVNDNMTTLFTTLVYGTYIEGKYAQVVRSTSSIFYLVSQTAIPSITPTNVQDIIATTSPTIFDKEKDFEDIITTTSSSLLEEEKDLSSNDDTIKKKENIFDDLFSEFQTDNAIGRSVNGKSSNKAINNFHEIKLGEKEELTTPIPPIVQNLTTTTYTFYTTFLQDGAPVVKTNIETTQSEPVYEIITKPGDKKSDLTTLTHHTTKFVEGITEVKSSLEVIPTTSLPTTPPNDLFFDIMTTDSATESNNLEITTEENGSITEITTETPNLDTTESPGFSLESSLKPDDAVNAIYFPRTYYTTYTYFTTYHRLNTSSIVSSLETITNIITNDSELEEHKTITPAIPTYPVTYWTTYTYWTTLVKNNSSITTSSKKTVSNIVNLTGKDTTSAVSDYINPVKPTVLSIENTSTQDVTTFYTTYTYYTTATIGNSVVVSSRLETESSVVRSGIPLKALSSDASDEAFGLIFDITPTQTLPNILESITKTTPSIETSTSTITTTPETPKSTTETSPDPILEITTEEPIINIEEDFTPTTESGLEGFLGFFGFGGTETTESVAEAKSNVELFNPPVTETVDINSKTGLLSTIRGSTINDGMTTLLSTNIYGTYIDGLYVQIQSTTSDVLENTPEVETLKQTGVLTVNAGSIVENEVTTHYTTQRVGKYINQKYNEEIISTSRIEIGPEKSVIETNPTKTGRVREIIGSIIHGTKTTYYHSTILGTVIAGIYAQKVDSTSRFVSGPSIAFDILTDLPKIETTKITTTSPILEASIETTISPTPVVIATESLELENTIKNTLEEVEEDLNSSSTSRLAFAIRTTASKRRTDVFPFIRRTSTFRKKDALSKVLAAPTAKKITETVTPKPEPQIESPVTTPKPPPSTRQFRFGFLEKSSPRRVKSTGKSGKKSIIVSEPPAIVRQIPDTTSQKPEEETTTSSFRAFRFREKSSLSGTRSHLPISRRNRPSQAEGKQTSQGSRFRFGTLPETTTKQPRPPKTTTPKATTEASSSKRPNPFSFLGRPRDEKRKETHKPLRKPSRNKVPRPTSTQQQSIKPHDIIKPHIIPKLPTAPKPPVAAKPFRQRGSLGGLPPRRRPIIPRLNKDESQVDAVYLLPDGTVPEGNFDDIEIITFSNKDAIHREKRDASNRRTSSRGVRRFVRNRDAKNSNKQAEDVISPSPSEPEKARQPFTLSNPRSARPGLRSRSSNPKPQKPSPVRGTIPSRTKSRNTLPFRPRRPRLQSMRKETTAPATPKRGFRRPSNDNRFKISNRFRPKVEQKNDDNTPPRRPSQFAVNRNRAPVRQPPTKSNPIQSFLDRPKPKPKPKPVILPKEDGSFSIVEALTVTREVPVTTTIPLIENGKTVEKKVITASLVTETFMPDQITQTEIDGEIKLLLSTVENKQRVTQVFIQPIPSTSLVYTSLIHRGVEKTETQTIPVTLYSVVTATAPKTESDVQDLLKLLILQQQQQNPFLAALGLNQPRVEHETRTFVTTITSLVSTEIPIIFRGKPIRTTVVDTNTEVITTTEITTKTLSGNPVASPSPFGPLLPLLLQNQLNRKARDIRPTSVIRENHTAIKDQDKRFKRSNHAIDKDMTYGLLSEGKVLPQNEIEIWPALKIEEQTHHNIPTPPLPSVLEPKTSSSDHFLSNGPAEFTPLQRTVRSAQRGKRIRQRIRVRNNGARKIENGAQDEIQILDSSLDKSMANNKKVNSKPNENRVNKATTFYTTFTYYTTYLDDLDREIVKSSEETITQVATYGNIRFDDFTKISPTVQTKDLTTVPIQEMFTLEDAIIPGKPRPVPDPVFEEPDPPHGPIIHHGETTNLAPKNKVKTKRRKTIVRLRNQNLPRGRARKQITKTRLSSPVNTLTGDSLLTQSDPPTTPSEVLLNKKYASNKPRRIRLKLTRTKKRQVDQQTTKHVTDEHISNLGSRKRVVITRRLPQQQSAVNEAPDNLFLRTVNVLHTVYSYHYSIYDQVSLVSTSMRVITVSNSVEPTLVQVPTEYRTVAPASNLYTIKEGKHTTTLGDRIENGYTTKIYLSSATLANIRPELSPSSAIGFSQNVKQENDLSSYSDFTKTQTDPFEFTKKLTSSVDLTKDLVSSFDFGKDLSSSLDFTNELIRSIDFRGEVISSIDFTRDLFSGIILQSSVKEISSKPSIEAITSTQPVVKRTRKMSIAAVDFSQNIKQDNDLSSSTDFTKNLADPFEFTKMLTSSVDFTKDLGSSFDFGKDLTGSLELTNELISSVEFTRELSSSIDFTRDLFGGIILQPSIKEISSNPTIKTPTFAQPVVKRTRKISRTALEQDKTQAHKESTPELNISQAKNTVSNVLRKSSLSSKDSERQVYNRRKTPSKTPEETTTRHEEEFTETATFIPEQPEDINILDIFDETYANVQEKELKSTLALVTSQPSRPSVRRDDIPIIRRPIGLRPARTHSTSNQLNSFSSTKLTEQPIDIATTPATTNNVEDELQLISPNIDSAADPSKSLHSLFDSVFSETSPNSEVHPESTTKFSLSQQIFSLRSPQPNNKSEGAENNDYYYYDDYTYEDNDKDYAALVDVTTESPEESTPPTTLDPDRPPPKSIFDIFGFLSNRKSVNRSSDKKKVEDIVDTTKISTSSINDIQIYSTYTTSTLLPILGGEQSTTLTLLTSKLISGQNRGLTAKHREIPRSKLYSSIDSATLTYDDTPFFGTLSSDVSGARSLADGASLISDGETRPHRFSDFGLDGHHKLATKVMENGVEVIVAEDPPRSGEEQAAKDAIRPSNRGSHAPVTLPPSTLSNQVVFTSPPEKWKESSVGTNQMFHFKTYFTTLTYYNTLVQKGTPVVRTSKETISNIVSAPLSLKGNYVEKTKIDLTTSTYLATQTYTTSIGDLLNHHIVTSKEVITQVVVTEVPSISRQKVEATAAPSYSTVITKTYLTTYTFYKTFDEGLVVTETVVSSDVVTEASLQSSPLLPVISLTKSFNQAPEESPFKIYATKTYYTTSTYLTTILKGTKTITSSHIEVTSNIKTEPVTSILNTGDILSHGENVHPVGNRDYHFEEVNYLPIHDNLYKEFRTLFATYTHYTTLHNGRVKSNEVTKTELITSLISTTNVPSSLLMKTEDSTINPNSISIPPSNTATIFNKFFNVQLDPSYTESLTKKPPVQTLNSQHSSRNSPKESSSLKATVLVEEGSETGTSVVHDSTTKATLLVRPTTENSSIEEAADAGIIETKSLSSQPFVIETTPILVNEVGLNKPTPTDLPTRTTVGLQVEGSNREPANEEDLVSSLVRRDETTTSSAIYTEPEPTVSGSEPVRIGGSDPVRIENDDLSIGEGTSTEVGSPNEEKPTKEGGSFGIGIPPMLTAVAGLIGNTFVGKLAGQAGVRRSETEQPILPKNAIVAADNGPLLIPVGGVGASLSSSQHSSTEPEQGFIPLHRPAFSETFKSSPLNATSNTLQSLVSMEKFAPSFEPPIKTESGFTAMTQSINPTSVSVISGEETIFFGGLHSMTPPSLEDKLSGGNVNNFEPGSDTQDASLSGREVIKVTSHSLYSQTDSESLSHSEKVSLPSLVGLNPRENPNYVEDSQIDPTFLEATVGIGDAPKETSHQTLHLGEDKRTTLIRGVSTVMSGVTTIFDTLYTKPSHMNDTTLPLKPVFEMFDTEYASEISQAVTTTHFDPLDKSLATEVIQHIPDLTTFVPTVINTSVQSNTLKSISSLKNFHESQLDNYAMPKLRTITVGPSTAFEAHFDGAELYRNDPYPDTIIRNEANLGYEEENEVNRFIESHSPDQEVGEPKKTPLCNRDCKSNEICNVFNQEQICICKPGYSRKIPSDACSKSNSFQVDLVLDKFQDTPLFFTEQLTNKSHPNTKYLIEEIDTGISEAMKRSDLGEKYRSSSILEFDEYLDSEKSQLLARVKIDIDNDETEGTFLRGSLFSSGGSPDETQVRFALEDSLHQLNYSLGGGNVVTRKESAVLAATDFDECQADEHNDCHSNAICINLAGTFGCECKEGFRDLFSDEVRDPGRQCIESNTCSYCNYHGKCQENLNEKTTCLCNDWFSGERCEINMKVMLIAVVSVGAFLLLLLLIFIVFCCCRTRKENQGGFLRSSNQEPSTLDRRAMIHDTSSESSEDLTRIHSGTLLEGKFPPIPRTPRADYSIGKGSLISTLSKDRSMTVRTSIPSVVIPRIKGYSTSNRSYTLEKESSKFNYGTTTSREASLVDILDGGPCPHMIQDGDARDTVLSVHSYGRRSRSQERLDHHHDHHHHPWHRGNGEVDAVHHSMRSRSSSRPDHIHHQVESVRRSGSEDRLRSRSGYQDIVSEVEARSFSYADRAVSQARSYDETTVRPPIRTLKDESFRSRDVSSQILSSQILSDGMPTNAERDGNSTTTVFPQMQLYKPLREGDSVSDFTGRQRFHRNEFFE